MISQRVIESMFWQKSISVCVYLNMPREVATVEVVSQALGIWLFCDLAVEAEGKRCFVPKIVEQEMRLLRVYSVEDLQSFPKVVYSKFSVIEPPLEYQGKPREDVWEKGVDLVIVPGTLYTCSPVHG